MSDFDENDLPEELQPLKCSPIAIPPDEFYQEDRFMPRHERKNKIRVYRICYCEVCGRKIVVSLDGSDDVCPRCKPSSDTKEEEVDLEHNNKCKGCGNAVRTVQRGIVVLHCSNCKRG